MLTNLTDLADTLQTLFTTHAHELAHTTHFVQRRRKLTGPAFAQVTVFGWLHNPTASLADLAELSTHLGTAVCPSALDQRFTQAAAVFLQALLAQALQDAARQGADSNDPTDQTLLTRFPGVYIDDSTTLGLPRALLPLFPGTGGRGGPTAAVKVPLRLELRRGVVELSDLQAGRSCDLASPLPHGPLPAGSLRLADLALISTGVNCPNVFRDCRASVRQNGGTGVCFQTRASVSARRPNARPPAAGCASACLR